MNRKKYFGLVAIALLQLTSLQSQNWSALPFNLDFPAQCLYEDTANGLLYIGGSFEEVDGFPTYGIVSFDGNAWDTLRSDGFAWPVTAICNFNDQLYIGGFGGLMIIDTDTIERIPCDGQIRGFYEYNGQLLVGGLFSKIGQDSISALAVRSGNGWAEFQDSQQLFAGTLNSVKRILEYQGELYVAGNFTENGGFSEIMRWNGQSWNDLDGGIDAGGSAWVNDLEIYQGELFVAGNFSEQNGAPGNNIAKWNGQVWSRVGEGSSSGQVFDLAVYQDKLYLAGQYDRVGTVTADYIAHWDGNSYCSFGGEINNAISSMSEFQGSFFIAGGFTDMSGFPISYLAKWEGGNHTDTCGPVNVSNLPAGFPGLINISPNPAYDKIWIGIPKSFGKSSFRILDLHGRVVIPWQSQSQLPVNIMALKTGVYFVEILSKKGLQFAKFVHY